MAVVNRVRFTPLDEGFFFLFCGLGLNDWDRLDRVGGWITNEVCVASGEKWHTLRWAHFACHREGQMTVKGRNWSQQIGPKLFHYFVNCILVLNHNNIVFVIIVVALILNVYLPRSYFNSPLSSITMILRFNLFSVHYLFQTILFMLFYASCHLFT